MVCSFPRDATSHHHAPHCIRVSGTEVVPFLVWSPTLSLQAKGRGRGGGGLGRCGPAFFPTAAVMKNEFLRGSFRNALKMALEEATWGNSREDEVRQERGWKVLM